MKVESQFCGSGGNLAGFAAQATIFFEPVAGAVLLAADWVGARPDVDRLARAEG